MFVVAVTFTIQPGAMAGFLPLMLDNAQRSLNDEPRCRQFDVCTSEDNPDEVFLYELYDDEAAFQQHLSMPHYEQFAERTAPMVIDKMVKTYTRRED